jgi:hypothetical protein
VTTPRKKKTPPAEIHTITFVSDGRRYFLNQTHRVGGTIKMDDWSLVWAADANEDITIGAGCVHTLTPILTDLYRGELPHVDIGRVDPERGELVNKITICPKCLDRINRINGG